eukprot:g2294.t1
MAQVVARDIFELIDKDCDGFISMKEMMRAVAYDRDLVQRIEAVPSLGRLLRPSTWKETFQSMDMEIDKDGRISKDEFLQFTSRIIEKHSDGNDADAADDEQAALTVSIVKLQSLERGRQGRQNYALKEHQLVSWNSAVLKIRKFQKACPSETLRTGFQRLSLNADAYVPRDDFFDFLLHHRVLRLEEAEVDACRRKMDPLHTGVINFYDFMRSIDSHVLLDPRQVALHNKRKDEKNVLQARLIDKDFQLSSRNQEVLERYESKEKLARFQQQQQQRIDAEVADAYNTWMKEVRQDNRWSKLTNYEKYRIESTKRLDAEALRQELLREAHLAALRERNFVQHRKEFTARVSSQPNTAGEQTKKKKSRLLIERGDNVEMMWERMRDSRGRIFYRNMATMEVEWRIPKGGCLIGRTAKKRIIERKQEKVTQCAKRNAERKDVHQREVAALNDLAHSMTTLGASHLVSGTQLLHVSPPSKNQSSGRRISPNAKRRQSASFSEKAASRIQAAQRGRVARREVRERRNINKLDRYLEVSKTLDSERIDAAASVIQRHARGTQGRKSARSKKQRHIAARQIQRNARGRSVRRMRRDVESAVRSAHFERAKDKFTMEDEMQRIYY